MKTIYMSIFGNLTKKTRPRSYQPGTEDAFPL